MDTTGGESVTAVSAIRIIEDDSLPNVIKTSLARANFIGGPNVNSTDTVYEAMSGSIVYKAKRLLEFGENGYDRGPTRCKAFNQESNKLAVLNVLETLVGQSISFRYFKLTPLNLKHVIWQRLVDNYGYDQTTNKITSMFNQFNTDVYLSDIQMVYTQAYWNSVNPEATGDWGVAPKAGPTPRRHFEEPEPTYDEDGNEVPIPPRRVSYTPPIISSTATQNYAVIKYVYETGSGGVISSKHNGEFTINLETFPKGNYYQIKYIYQVGTTSYIRYWTYLANSGTYPTIDDMDSSVTDEFGSFYPWIFYVFNGEELASDAFKDTPRYASAKRASKYLGIDYKSFGESIYDSPDINKVSFSFACLSVPMDTTNQIEIRYLYKFFQRLKDQYTVQYQDTENANGTITYAPQSDGVVISIGQSESPSPYYFDLGLRQIKEEVVVGSIGAKGTYAFEYNSSVGPSLDREFYQDGDGELQSIRYPATAYIYKYQKSEDTYVKLSVMGPKIVYRATRRHYYHTSAKDDALLIPLDASLIEDFKFRDKEQLLARSLHLIVVAKDSVKVDWYESEAFRVVLIIAAFVITALTWDPTTISTALGLTGAQAILADILFNLAIASAFSYGFKKLVAELGLENSAILAVIAYTVAAVYGKGTFSLPGLPISTDLLTLANGLVQAISSVSAELMEDIAKEAEAFAQMAEDKMAELDALQKKLDGNGLIDPLEVARLEPFILFGETPDEYYQRTAHSGNVGIIGLAAVGNYVGTSLTLPKPYETLSEE